MPPQAKRSRPVEGAPQQIEAVSPDHAAVRRRSEEPPSDADQSQRRQQLYRLKLRELEERLSRLRSEVQDT